VDEACNPLVAPHGVLARFRGLLRADEEDVLVLGRDHDLSVTVAQADGLSTGLCFRHRSSLVNRRSRNDRDCSKEVGLGKMPPLHFPGISSDWDERDGLRELVEPSGNQP
jgi:hypothetical protein